MKKLILYLTENFQFLPKIIHSNFEMTLGIAIKKIKILKMLYILVVFFTIPKRLEIKLKKYIIKIKY